MRLFKSVPTAFTALAVTVLFLSCARTVGGIHTELVELKTADGIRLSGALRQPRSVSARAAVLMVHGYGGNFYSGLMAFLPEALTALHYVTLAVNMRDHDRGPKKNRFEENRLDIAAGVDELVQRGHRTIFLHGHSMGTNRVLYYLAQTGDPRIKGLILTGPPGNLLQWNERVFGKERATRVLRQAQELVSSGKGEEWIPVDLGPLGKALYTANHVVSLRGPATHSDPFNNIARISKPAIIVHGLADRLADPSVADRLQQSAGSDSEVTVHKIAGANHRFWGHEDALVGVISQWLVQQLNE